MPGETVKLSNGPPSLNLYIRGMGLMIYKWQRLLVKFVCASYETTQLISG